MKFFKLEDADLSLLSVKGAEGKNYYNDVSSVKVYSGYKDFIQKSSNKKLIHDALNESSFTPGTVRNLPKGFEYLLLNVEGGAYIMAGSASSDNTTEQSESENDEKSESSEPKTLSMNEVTVFTHYYKLVVKYKDSKDKSALSFLSS